MAKYWILLFIATITLTAAKPSPGIDDDGQEILNGRDTRYYGLPFFWYQRPLTGDDGDDYGSNAGGFGSRPTYRHKKKHTAPVYETAGAGWGR